MNLAVIGCGAVSRMWHLPAARALEGVKVTALVEKDAERARELAEEFDVPHVCTNVAGLPRGIDAAVVAAPNFLHGPISLELLERGIAVLVEKPMALGEAEARRMIETAAARGLPLVVGLNYRYSQGARMVKRALDEGWLGPVREFALENGRVYDWPAVSGAVFSREHAGGGQLMDIGSHMLDLLLWWLGPPTRVTYRDDSRGGVEADCLLELTLGHRDAEVPGTVRLSRIRSLGNFARIVGERFTIEFDMTSLDRVRIRPTSWSCADGDPAFGVQWGEGPRQAWLDLYVGQIRDFAAAVRGLAPPAIPGESALGTVALIERCYRERRPIEEPWLASRPEPAPAGGAR